MATYSGQNKILAGGILILIGVLLLLDNACYLDFGYLIGTFWPCILIIIGVSRIITSRSYSNNAGLTLIVIGLFFQLIELDIISWWHFSHFWPAVLIFIGIWIILKKGRQSDYTKKDYTSKMEDEDSFNITSIFSGRKIVVTSSKFTSGECLVLFGGAEIYFRNAELLDNEAVIEVTVLFGGINLNIPPEWEVRISALPIFGGIDDKRIFSEPAESTKRPLLHIKGLVMFGGVDIKNP